MECSICCESYNKTKRKLVQCAFCDYQSCTECISKYLLESVNDPHCPSCKKAWDRPFMDKWFTKTFVNKNLKNHRENVLLEREKSLMPETQFYVNQEIKKREALREIERLRIARIQIEHDIARLYVSLTFQDREVEAPRREFIKKCPVENCKGFLSSKWKCEICTNYICKDCNEIKGENHTCTKEALETMELIRKDSKGCPGCGTLISRISGCAQMWCPSCHIAFNWNTLQIENGIIHNPHFFDFQRKHGIRNRAHGDIPCGGRPHPSELPLVNRNVHNILRQLGHIDALYINYHYRYTPPPDNRELRIKYMLNEISEEDFKIKIQRIEKTYRRKTEIRQVLQMLVDTAGDILRQMVREPHRVNEFQDVLQELRMYYNQSQEMLSVRYNCVTPRLNSMWEVRITKDGFAVD